MVDYLIKDGELMIKTLFLYRKGSKKEIPMINDIYKFNNTILVAIDAHVYDTKRERKYLQHKFEIFPYYLPQNIIFNMVEYSINEPGHLFLKNIIICDEEIKETDEYNKLKNDINHNKNEVMNDLDILMDDYDIRIDGATFIFSGYKFTLFLTGVIEVDSTEKVLEKFINDKIINNLLLGDKK